MVFTYMKPEIYERVVKERVNTTTLLALDMDLVKIRYLLDMQATFVIIYLQMKMVEHNLHIMTAF